MYLRWCFPDPRSCCAAGRGDPKPITGTQGGFAVRCFNTPAAAVPGTGCFLENTHFFPELLVFVGP